MPSKWLEKIGQVMKIDNLNWNTSTTSSVYIDYLKPKLATFAEHNFFAKWQDIQFKNLLKNIPQDVSVINFAKNYGFKVQDEVQSMHWHTTQVTILIHITYRWQCMQLHKVLTQVQEDP